MKARLKLIWKTWRWFFQTLAIILQILELNLNELNVSLFDPA
jgi:hypothetical protein